MSNRTLYDHQQRALTMLRESLSSGHRRPVLQLPTGGGKTVIASTITRGAMVKGNSVLFTVPSVSLVDQSLRMFCDEGIHDVGVMQADHPNTNAMMPVQVATIQTLQRRAIPKVSLVMIDECHVYFKFICEWMNLPGWETVPFIGLSATPWTKGLGQHYDDYLVAATTGELINTINPSTGRPFLSPFKVFAPSHPDLTGVKVVAGDYHEGQLSERMRGAELVADVVGTWRRMARGRPTLVFCVDRAHAQVLHEKFSEAGVFTEYVDAFTPREEREAIRERMASGETEVVCNIGCLTTGTDWPFVSCIVLARPTKSEMLYVQIVGRGLRSFEGKDHCLILDHSDTTQRLGFVTNIGRDELDDGRPNKSGKHQKKPPEPRECGACNALIPPATRKCPECGHEFKVVSSVRYAKGELVEITSKSKKPVVSMETKQRWYSMLLGHAQRRGMKLGWAYHKFQEKFGVYPAHTLQKIGTDPDAEVARWITSRAIAWRNSKHNPANASTGAPL